MYRYTKERNINELHHNSMYGYENNRNSPVYRYTRTAPLFYRADLELSQYLISVFCFRLHYWKLLMHVKKFGQWSKLRVMTYRNKWPWEFCVRLRHCLWNCFPTKDPLLSLFCRKWINLLSTRVCLLRQQRGDIFCWKFWPQEGEHYAYSGLDLAVHGVTTAN